jgi:PTH1 family peptidyl-tRNA hydrolase
MEDIIRLVGSDEIPRLKIGIRTEDEKNELAHQVLSRIPKRQVNRVDKILEIATDAVENIISDGMSSAMSTFNNYEID